MPKNAECTAQLIIEAEAILMAGPDPLHDHRHAARVADYAAQIATACHIVDERQLDALQLSAWWHDVSRVLISKPSFLLMPFIDDTLSACVLFWYALRSRGVNRTTWLAARLVLGKSIATGRLFSRIFLTKRMQILLDILQDADTVDTLAVERTEEIHALVDSSRLYHYGYRMMVWWFLSTAFFDLNTHAAKEHLARVFVQFFEWMQDETNRRWHIERYGEVWVHGFLTKLEATLRDLEKELGFPILRTT